MRLALSALLIGSFVGCDDGDGSPAVDAGADAAVDLAPPPGGDGTTWAQTFGLAGGAEVTAGQTFVSDDRFGDASEADGAGEDWPRLHVDPTAGAGGDGSEAEPFANLTDALAAAGAAPAVLSLSAGEHVGPITAAGPLVVVGAGADATRVTAPEADPVIRATGVELLGVARLHVVGGRRGVVVEDVPSVVLRQARISGASEIGLDLRGGTAAVFDSAIRDIGMVHLQAVDARLGLRGVVVGPGDGVGVRVSGEAVPADCVDARSPVCPYAGLLAMTTSVVTGVVGRGVEVDHGLLSLFGSRVEAVGGDGTAAGVAASQTFTLIGGGSVVAGVDGQGVVLGSCRADIEGLLVEDNAAGGLNLQRAAAPSAFPGGAFSPSPDWFPGGMWRIGPDAFPGGMWSPPPNWFPGGMWFPRPNDLPPSLGLDTPAGEQAPDLDLHLWARADVRGVAAIGNGAYGLRLATHAARVADVEVSGTTGEASAALQIAQGSATTLGEMGSSVVTISEIDGARLSGNEGVGLRVTAVALIEGEGGGAFIHRRRLGLSNISSGENTGGGVHLRQASVHLHGSALNGNRGFGLSAQGCICLIEDNDIGDTRLGAQTGPGGEVTEAADGMHLQGTDFIENYADNLLVDGNRVTGSARVGVLVDARLATMSGRLVFGAGAALSDNVIEAAWIGARDGVEVEGVDFVDATAEDLPPPQP